MEKLLQQILSEITGMKSEITGMKSEIANIKSNMATKSDIQDLKASTNNRFDTIETKMALLEKNMATKEDVADISAIKRASLEVSEKVNDLVDEKDSKINALNKRLFKVESFIERLSNQ